MAELSPEALEPCKEQIIKEIDTLNDLPPKLRDSIASFYYHFSLLSQDVMKSGGVPSGLFDSSDLAGALNRWSEDLAWWTSAVSAIPDYVESLRQIDRSKQPRIYSYSVDFINDQICYDLSSIGMMPAIVRKFFLLFKRRKFEVIPGLADIIMSES